MNCAGCGREMKDGDPCIKGMPSEFTGQVANPIIDDLVSMVLGGGTKTDVLVYCLNCTVHKDGGFDVVPYREEWAERGGE